MGPGQDEGSGSCAAFAVGPSHSETPVPTPLRVPQDAARAGHYVQTAVVVYCPAGAYILGWLRGWPWTLPGQLQPRGEAGRGVAEGPGWALVAPQLGLTWLEETDETSVLWAELEMSESSDMGFPQTVSMMQARNCGGRTQRLSSGGSPLSRIPSPGPVIPSLVPP